MEYDRTKDRQRILDEYMIDSSMLEISSGLWSKTFSVLLQENSVRATN
jgi:hypothetical protein